ncbi:MAG TPA: hypothetical protein VKX31_04370 [Brumimicrobium sp.]|nr:hypothetical protein [Brumimicrobium sp.]
MTDCGGVCPPCSTDPNPVFSFLTVSVNGKSVYFGDYTLEKSSVWTLQFKNDSIDVKLNLGGGDSLGERPIESVGSSGEYRQLNYPVLYSGRSVFSEVNQEDNRLSAYFQAKFIAVNGIDTLFLSDGEFQNISW